ncbi:RHS repeat domain-containing protein [Cysteiniphilum halobium]|uniref:RHS repeat domain-containing protein n=1 Tax=Cysteiniphilum halobium TaxID=2219059 RepID=UPI003F85B0F6
MLNNKSKLCIGMIMSCLLITQSIAYSLDSIKSVDKQSVNHRSVLVSAAIHYTANGNISMDNQGASFSYNAANELTQVSLASGAKEGDYYYANGLRSVAQNSTKVLVHYYSRHNQLLNTSDGAQQSSTYLITNNAVVRSVNGNATVLLRNRHGSVIGQLGDKPKFYQYSVYGVQRTEDRGQKTDHESGSLDLAINPLRYSSYMFDPLTGLYYLKARDYDPGLRSFMQADSYAFNNHRLINGYFYGNSNPLMVVDPSGHMGVFRDFFKGPPTKRGILQEEQGIEMTLLSSQSDMGLHTTPSQSDISLYNTLNQTDINSPSIPRQSTIRLPPKKDIRFETSYNPKSIEEMEYNVIYSHHLSTGKILLEENIQGLGHLTQMQSTESTHNQNAIIILSIKQDLASHSFTAPEGMDKSSANNLIKIAKGETEPLESYPTNDNVEKSLGYYSSNPDIGNLLISHSKTDLNIDILKLNGIESTSITMQEMLKILAENNYKYKNVWIV